MGIRIHKCLGYGIEFKRDLNCSTYDSKLAVDLLNLPENLYSKKVKEELLIALENDAKSDIELRFLLNKFKEDMNESFSFFDVYGFSDEHFQNETQLVIFYPPINPDWRRYDDAMDYYENAIKSDLYKSNDEYPKDFSNWIPSPLYPYLGYQIDGVVPKQDNIIISDMLRRDGTTYGILAEQTLQELGMASFEELRLRCLPQIPKSIVWMCKYFQIFSDEKLVYSLKPVIAEWWS